MPDLEKIHGIPGRIATLKRKLEARKGKPEFRENVIAIEAEIARLEQATQNRQALREFAESEVVASSGDEDKL